MSGEAASLWQALALMPDHRRDAGKRYPLASLLLIAVAAMLSGRRDQLGIVRWGRRLSQEALEAIGIRRNRVPAPSVWCELFQGLDIAALERVLGHWVRGEQSAEHVAIGSLPLRRRGASGCAAAPRVSLLAAFSGKLQGVIGQLRVAPGANEITAALELLKTVPLEGVTITGDAIFTQREICRVIIEGGGAYFFTVKACPCEGGGQPAGTESRHCLGLRAGFPPQRNGRRRLTSGRPRRSRKATAGSKPAGWRLPPASPSIWHRPGAAWPRSVA